MKQKMVEGEDGQETSHAGIPRAISRMNKERQCDKNLTRSLPLKSFETIHLSFFSFFSFSGLFRWLKSVALKPLCFSEVDASADIVPQAVFSTLHDDFFGILSRDFPGI
jgi:hypothetical protein